MQTLRRASAITRFVLVWFALTIGVAVASPLVKPQAMELVCSAGGAMQLIVKGEGDVKASHNPALDCPLCATPGAPPSAARAPASLAGACAHALRPIAAMHVVARAAAPLPPRGPPTPV